MAGRLDGCLARRLADWLERSTGEFHLASKYGKNASCSSWRYQRSSAGIRVFRAPVQLCACRHAARSYAWLDVEVNRRGVTPKRTRQCRRAAAEAVVSKSSRPFSVFLLGEP